MNTNAMPFHLVAVTAEDGLESPTFRFVVNDEGLGNIESWIEEENECSCFTSLEVEETAVGFLDDLLERADDSAYEDMQAYLRSLNGWPIEEDWQEEHLDALADVFNISLENIIQ